MIGMAWTFDFFCVYSNVSQKFSTSFLPLNDDL